jgi:hypothetical protein
VDGEVLACTSCPDAENYDPIVDCTIPKCHELSEK